MSDVEEEDDDYMSDQLLAKMYVCNVSVDFVFK